MQINWSIMGINGTNRELTKLKAVSVHRKYGKMYLSLKNKEGERGIWKVTAKLLPPSPPDWT